MREIFGRLTMLIVLATYLTPLHAERPSFGPTDTEFAMLPPYCHARLKGDDTARSLWNQRMRRENFVHVHHYCFGLNFINRSRLTFDKKQRKEYLQAAIKQFDYVLKRWPTNFPLTPEAKNYQMQAEMMLKQL